MPVDKYTAEERGTSHTDSYQVGHVVLVVMVVRVSMVIMVITVIMIMGMGRAWTWARL